MNYKTPEDILVDKGYGDVIVFRNPDYTDALVGLTSKYNAVYDYDLMIEWLVTHENMDFEEAADFISYNDSFYYGENYPVIYYGEDYEISIEEDEEYELLIFTKLSDLPDLN